jgi:hypothetical protein
MQLTWRLPCSPHTPSSLPQTHTTLLFVHADHLQLLEEMQDLGQLGCFALTERLAGVNSGLVVETTATYDPATQSYELHTPYPGAAKNWISQGCVADYTVVTANLIVAGKSLGPHAFLMRVRETLGSLADTPTVALRPPGREEGPLGWQRGKAERTNALSPPRGHSHTPSQLPLAFPCVRACVRVCVSADARLERHAGERDRAGRHGRQDHRQRPRQRLDHV